MVGLKDGTSECFQSILHPSLEPSSAGRHVEYFKLVKVFFSTLDSKAWSVMKSSSLSVSFNPVFFLLLSLNITPRITLNKHYAEHYSAP